ncbi:MAG: chorismate mutase [Allosphingosinicella sp.]
MDSNITPPEACRDMAEVRQGVDAVDREIVALLARRFGYMDAAARIKPDRESVRDEARKAEVLRNVAAHAERHGIPAAPLAALWEGLVEASIAYEFDRYDAIRAGGKAAAAG